MMSSLHGVRVAVTRPPADTDELTSLLRARGADAVEIPLLRITGPSDPADFHRALESLDSYDWIVFTSANAVRAVARGLEAVARSTVPAARVAAVGPATADAVTAELGWRVALIPPVHTGAALAAAILTDEGIAGQRVLWPRARDARESVRRDLTGAGAVLDDPEAYGSAPVPEAAHELARMLGRRELDVLTLTSPGAVAAFMAAQPQTGDCVIAVIGASTREAAEDAGLRVHVEPPEHTIRALVDELERYLAHTRT
jgi:uroporphyrinogen-III synthase